MPEPRDRKSEPEVQRAVSYARRMLATVRLELDAWTGNRFTDLFTLLEVDGEWKIMNKVFHLHT